ncbi:hypothetical protein COO59_17095 [Mixta theicola]|uniref:Polymer-forming cytoskeletal protein n=1 Tax=Mixta theicola TaxID=1458355 RepID=A0A2K1Q618_9GAMM|nr:polymer-forming cytoskeletal protein [Mixta theicola]PNS10475.1 hypothetical protein COO59_17095 [Mixta theicola]GLR08273.1 membrane protein [Mixta theicola]
MNYKLLWGIWFIWALALLAYCLQWEAHQGLLNILLKIAPIILSLIILFFMRYLLPHKGLKMFKRKEILNENNHSSSTEPEEIISVTSLPELQETALAAVGMEKNTTIIPPSCHIKGEINTSGDICISGSVNGIITAEKTVYVLHHGNVEGEIYAEKVVVDGKLTGTCASETVEINANGYIDGTIESDDLSINKSGHFYGISKPRTGKQTQADRAAENPDYTDKATVKESSIENFSMVQHFPDNMQEEYTP